MSNIIDQLNATAQDARTAQDGLIRHGQRGVRNGCRRCGSPTWWTHDPNGHTGRKLCDDAKCAGYGKYSNWTMINRDGTMHDCQHLAANVTAQTEPDTDDNTPATTGPAIPGVTVTPEPAPAVAPSVPASTDPAMAAFQAFMNAVAPKVDAGQVREIVEERLRGLILPTRVEVVRNGDVKPVEGMAHNRLPMVIKVLSAGKHVMMVGPAGTGKSHIAGQAAEALSLESYSISLSPQTPTSAILGYMTATGDHVRSLFREAYEHGGVFHFDEVDNSHPSCWP